MPKTYNTIPTVSTGDVYTATAHNKIVTNVNNYRVPPMCQVYLTANRTITSHSDISWDAKRFDTDSMWTSGGTLSVTTEGVYQVTFQGRFTLSGAAAAFNAVILRSGTAICQWNPAAEAAPPTTDYRITGSTIASFTAGQNISARVYVGGTITGDGTNNGTTVTLSAVWLGQVS